MGADKSVNIRLSLATLNQLKPECILCIQHSKHAIGLTS